MANEYRISQLRAEVFVKVVDAVPPAARISQLRGEVFVKHQKAYPPDGHRYWRFRFIDTQNASATARLSEIRFYDPGGKDITFPGRWSASAGSALEPESFNNVTSDGFDSGGTMPVTVTTDAFDAGEIEIGTYSLRARSGSSYNNMPSEWYLEYSDDNSIWIEADHQVGVTWTDSQSRTFAVGGSGPSAERRRNFMSFNP